MALSIIKRAIAIDDSQSFAWFGAGFSYVNLAQYEEGLHACDRAIEHGMDVLDVWGFRGVCLQELGRHEEAVQSFNKLIEKNPKDKGGWNFKGKSLHVLGRFAEAAEAFAKAYELDNKNNAALFFQYISLIGTNEIQKALELGKAHEDILSQNKLYYWMKAVALSFVGQDVEALPCWQQVIDKGDCSSSIYLGKAGSLIALQRWDEANMALEGALTNCPDSKSPKEIGSAHVLAKLFITKQDAAFWQQGAQLFVSRFAEHEVLSSLAAGLAQSVIHIMKLTVSDATAKTWRDIWVKSSEGYPEMELALRLLETAIKYRSEKDQRVLMELPIEERKIFEEIIEKAEKGRK
jgi:tetratricopeptide (TPR) repeat protein